MRMPQLYFDLHSCFKTFSWPFIFDRKNCPFTDCEGKNFAVMSLKKNATRDLSSLHFLSLPQTWPMFCLVVYNIIHIFVVVKYLCAGVGDGNDWLRSSAKVVLR